MAFLARFVVGLAAAAAIVALALLLLLPMADRLNPEGSWVRNASAPEDRLGFLEIPPATGEVQVVEGQWEDEPVVVLVATRGHLDGVRAARGEEALSAAVGHPGSEDHVVFAYAATSTFLGCTVTWAPDLGASEDIPDYNGDGGPDGRFLDPCHQGQWDAFAGAMPLDGTAAPTPLARLHVEVRHVEGAWHLWATGFDGPVGATRN